MVITGESHAIAFFISFNLVSLDLLRFKSVAISIPDGFNNSSSPPPITNIFNYQSNIHPYNTRSSPSDNSFFEYSRLDKQSNYFSRNGTKVWNILHDGMTHSSKQKSRQKIHCVLLQNKILGGKLLHRFT